ncbi:MAG: ATP-binding protein [Paludibacteraceae bacterium]|nr:ATP-binding protein [Paludibacteraceae bacterium]
MQINRKTYLDALIASKGNDMIKVVTGLRRVGKSYLLFHIFYDYLKSQGVDDAHIIRIDLEPRRNKWLRDPDALLNYIDAKLLDDGQYYVLIDEIQHVPEFEDVLNSYLDMPNVDVYVTGSNAKFLSKDVLTIFRGRGDEIRVQPLSFAEYCQACEQHPTEALLREYLTFGGLPRAALCATQEQKKKYLRDLFRNTYLVDIVERNHLNDDADMKELIDVVASNIGCLTNSVKLQNTFKTTKKSSISYNTIDSYLDMLEDAFLIEHSTRYDIKGKKYINTPKKFYFMDLGLRNARLGFRQNEWTHLMENLIYIELVRRGYTVDVGNVEYNTSIEGKNVRLQLEVDFVCNRNEERLYVQSAYALPDEEKVAQELRPLRLINDSFQKVVIVGGLIPTHRTDDGILMLNILDFLTGKNYI